MSKLSKIFSSLAETSGKLDKLAILKANVGEEALRLSFFLAYNPQTNFYITADKLEQAKSGKIQLDASILKDVEAHLNGRLVTGNAARDYLQKVLNDLVPEDQVILKRIINRDLEVGASLGSAEKTWPGLIPSFPVMLADKFNEKTAIPFYAAETTGEPKMVAQLKCDGGRGAAVCENKKVTFFSRNGNEIEVHGHFDFLTAFEGSVVDGELLSIDANGKIRDRKTSNGIFNKAVRGTISPEEAASLRFVVWDLISMDEFRAGKGTEKYKSRFAKLTQKLKTLSTAERKFVTLVPSKEIKTMAEGMEFYADQVAAGEEGAMLKLLDGVWEDKRVKTILKLKEIQDATLRCVGVKPHSKNPELIGSLECETECGLLEVSIGTGLSGDDRKRPASDFVGNLIDMKFNQLILGRDSEKYSMFLPVYRAIRVDVKKADTLAKLKK